MIRLRNDKWKKHIVSTVALLLLTVSLTSNAATTYQEVSLGSRKQVLSGASSHIPGNSDLPIGTNSAGVVSVPFNVLYGVRKGLVTYYGEVPLAQKNENTKLRFYDGDTIDGRGRPFSGSSLSLDDPESDVHLKALTQSHGITDSLSSIGYSITSGINGIFSLAVKFMIMIKSIDLGTLLEGAFDDEFVKILRTIFLINPDTGEWSPVLIFAMVFFLVSLMALSFKIVKGDLSFRKLWTEAGMFILAILVSAIYLTPSNPGTISELSIDFITKFANNATLDSIGDGTGAVFVSNTGNDITDNYLTQAALIDKIYIDSIIEAQLGYPVDELNLDSLAGASEALANTFPDGEYMTIDVGGGRTCNNLGYYFWACNSNTAINSGWKDDGGKVAPILASNDRILYVVDFLANLKNAGGDAEKIDKIMNRLSNPDYGAAASSALILCAQNVSLAFASWTIAIFCLLGQVIIALGSYCMVVMPALLLFKGSREVAKKMIWTYLLSFLRYLIGSAIFNTMLVVNLLLAKQGISGVIFSIFVNILFAKFGPMIMRELNQWISSTMGRNEIRFINRYYQQASSHAAPFVGGRRGGRRFGAGMLGGLLPQIGHGKRNGGRKTPNLNTSYPDNGSESQETGHNPSNKPPGNETQEQAETGHHSRNGDRDDHEPQRRDEQGGDSEQIRDGDEFDPSLAYGSGAIAGEIDRMLGEDDQHIDNDDFVEKDSEDDTEESEPQKEEKKSEDEKHESKENDMEQEEEKEEKKEQKMKNETQKKDAQPSQHGEQHDYGKHIQGGSVGKVNEVNDDLPDNSEQIENRGVENELAEDGFKIVGEEPSSSHQTHTESSNKKDTKTVTAKQEKPSVQSDGSGSKDDMNEINIVGEQSAQPERSSSVVNDKDRTTNNGGTHKDPVLTKTSSPSHNVSTNDIQIQQKPNVQTSSTVPQQSPSLQTIHSQQMPTGKDSKDIKPQQKQSETRVVEKIVKEEKVVTKTVQVKEQQKEQSNQTVYNRTQAGQVENGVNLNSLKLNRQQPDGQNSQRRPSGKLTLNGKISRGKTVQQEKTVSHQQDSDRTQTNTLPLPQNSGLPDENEQ